jgi:hypothetical protein
VLKTPSDIYELGQTLLTNMKWISDFSAEEFGDTNGLIIIRKTKKDRQHNGQKEHKIARKTKDRVKRTPLTTGAELMCSRNVSSSCSTSSTRRVALDTNPVIVLPYIFTIV